MTKQHTFDDFHQRIITMLQKLKEQHGNTQRSPIFERNLIRDCFKVLPLED